MPVSVLLPAETDFVLGRDVNLDETFALDTTADLIKRLGVCRVRPRHQDFCLIYVPSLDSVVTYQREVAPNSEEASYPRVPPGLFALMGIIALQNCMKTSTEECSKLSKWAKKRFREIVSLYSTGARCESSMLVCALVKGLGDAVVPAASEIQSQGQCRWWNTDARVPTVHII